ncbi:MAG: hydantoinase/oxoprolinase family protein, partial [Nitrospinota bacterium]
MRLRYTLSFDIGGTFTDFVLCDEKEGTITVSKCPTTPADPSVGALAGLNELIRQEGLSLAETRMMVHSTTLVTNAIIERKGAKTGLLTTQGFRDVLELGREQFYDIYDLFAPFPAPLIPRYLRRGITERVTRDGTILIPLQPDEVLSTIAELQEAGVQSLAVALLHSYQNAGHEQRVAQLIREHFPTLFCSLSSEVAPLVGEYERTSTTVCDAYVKPLVHHYLQSLQRQLEGIGYGKSFYMMLSSGGTATVETAQNYPIRLLESGPAAGALAAKFYGNLIQREQLLSFDMGGTTAKTCLISGGEPYVARGMEVARVHRFKKGSGFPVMVPVIEMIEIGAGGGSIDWIDELGLLKVGPQSAGADPGPACYDKGGEEPTVTDANLLLGYLNPHYFLGGKMPLRREKALQAMQKLSAPLHISPTEVAQGIYDVVNENMAAAARIHIIERGHDPRRCTMIAFGGAGPAHACQVARILGVREVVIPMAAGNTSALGCLAAPLAFEQMASLPSQLEEADWEKVNRLFARLEEEGRKALREAGIDEETITCLYSADMRLTGQIHEIHIPLPPPPLSSASVPA